MVEAELVMSAGHDQVGAADDRQADRSSCRIIGCVRRGAVAIAGVPARGVPQRPGPAVPGLLADPSGQGLPGDVAATSRTFSFATGFFVHRMLGPLRRGMLPTPLGGDSTWRIEGKLGSERDRGSACFFDHTPCYLSADTRGERSPSRLL